MRILAGLILLGLSACAPDAEAETEPAAQPAMATIEIPGAATSVPTKARLMDMPDDPQAVRRLEAMGYTVHEDHLHAPGVNSCPKMGDGPVM